MVKREEISKKKDRKITTTPLTTRKPQPTTKANPTKKRQRAKSPDAPLPSSAAAEAAPSSLGPSPSSAAATDGRQIDALFSRLKRKHKSEPTQQAKTATTSGGNKVRGDSSVARRGRRPKQPSSIDEDLSLANRPRRYTEEGWPIYTEEELRIGQGGGTPLCPFDCDCCF
ncbi:unnamed protein product [Vitrella brassicaformis CCMP3155]|uniref:DUF1764 domain-containing protein n=1 Tax=Vitrella brassicaformis (strain CCMP3155) TaxID=1169540 RepID=A0A0G4F5Z7_VITBC|nr:unnamed protein product [Vitrella brassicaformis CCMP3155]|eukprot:CEM07797.1 unnamed protein product [Vitrella brassicaformis CCMP3155]